MNSVIKKFVVFFLLFSMFVPTVSAIEIEDVVLEGAHYWNGHYYQLFDAGVTWEDARIRCAQMGGHLVTITTAEEQAFVLSILGTGNKNMYWIGSRLNQNWAWVTGEDFSYSNWGPEEPNNMDGEEAYVQIYAKPFRKKVAGDWNDASNVGAEYSAEFYSLQNTGYICEWDMLDSDGDGLIDEWEINGIDTNGDDVPDLMINEMGADPNVPDIFVEVDWMVRPTQEILFWEISSGRTMKASDNAFYMVWQAFERYGIRLHIDAGPSSVDYVTGKTWGDLSGGNEIEYVSSFDTSNWANTIDTHFTPGREVAFKHCIFLDQYDHSGSSGLADGIPGQHFLVANQDWVYDGGDIAVAGTFMHELGHTLGLQHGGNEDLPNYKPNYLSVMNYSFQITGIPSLTQLWVLDYSRATLPDLDENNLNESDGVDPMGVTDGTGLGTNWYNKGSLESIMSVSGKSIDFNADGKLESGLRLDLNDDGKKTVLKGSSPDWDHIIYSGGRVGDMTAMGKSAKVSESSFPEEATVEEFLEHNALARKGDGIVRFASRTLRSNIGEQTLLVDIVNRGSCEMVYTVRLRSGDLNLDYVETITVPGSTSEMSSARIAVPIGAGLSAGEYPIHCTLQPEEGEKRTSEINVKVVNPSESELDEFSALLEAGTLAQYVGDPQVIEQITSSVNAEIIPPAQTDKIPQEDLVQPEGDPQLNSAQPEKHHEQEEIRCDHICHSDNFFVKIWWGIVRFFSKLFGWGQVCDCGKNHY